MSPISFYVIAAATAFALIGLGGGIYGFLVVDPFWQIPAHTAFELARNWLLVAFASHVAQRLWSAFDFIPKAPLDLITCFARTNIFLAAARLT